MSASAPFPVTVHPYPSPKVRHACAYELGPSSARNAVVFIGGLTDGPHTVPYIRTVAAKLQATPGLDYSVFEIRMRSSFFGFAWSSLANDVQDISALVKYLRGLGKQKIILFGHSTGCQDCIEYTDYDKHHNEPVDGFIIQGSISDREAYGDAMSAEAVDDIVSLTRDMIDNGKQKDAVPKSKLPPNFIFPCPFSAYRLYSLTAVGGDDDYFSSDLPDDTVRSIWQRVKKPILIVPSGKDEYVPASVDFAKLLAKWKSVCPVASDLSALIPEANHTVDPPSSQEWLAERVTRFLGGLEQ